MTDVTSTFEKNRAHLRQVAFRMLGSAGSSDQSFLTSGEVEITLADDTANMPLPATLSGDVTVHVKARTSGATRCVGPKQCDVQDQIDRQLALTLP